MKKLFYPLFLLLVSCGWTKVDPAKARAVAENFLTDQKNERYDSVDDYFTPSFNESEPQEKKIEKLLRIKDALGIIESYELTDTKVTNRGLDDPSTVQLTYKVNYTRGTTKQTFILMNEEGAPKITFENIEMSAPSVLEN